MNHIRNIITAAAVTIGLLVGAVTLAAPSTAGATVTTQTTTAQPDTVRAFWQYMYGLENTQAEYGYYVETGTPDAPVFVQEYGGNALQAFLLALGNPSTGCFALVSQGC